MNRRIFTQAVALAALASLVPAAAVAQSANKRHKIVIQMSDAEPGKWNLALNNAKNLQDDVGAAHVDIELVAYGPGIGMLKMDAPTHSRVADAVKSGVKILACENTMRNLKLVRDDMHAAISYVPAGVTQIMQRQSEGWAYLRP